MRVGGDDGIGFGYSFLFVVDLRGSVPTYAVLLSFHFHLSLPGNQIDSHGNLT